MAFEENENQAEEKRIERLIASENLFTRADALTEMIGFLANERDKPAHEVLPYILAAIDINLQLKRHDELAGNYWSLSDAYYEQKNYDEAIDALEKSIEAARYSGNESSLPMTLNNLGNIYNIKGDYENAVLWYESGLAAALEQSRNPQATQALMQLARIHQNEEEWDKAIECAYQAYGIFSGDNQNIGTIDALLQVVWAQMLRGGHYASDGTENLEKIEALLELVNHPQGAEAHQLLSCWFQIDKGVPTPATLASLDVLLREARNRNDASASSVITYVRAKYFAKERDYRQATVLLKSLLKTSDAVDSRIPKSDVFFELYQAQSFAKEHIDAAETALEYAKHCKELGHDDEEIAGYAWAGEHYLEAGMHKQAVEYLELQHKHWFGQDINQDFKPGTLLARAYLGAGRFTEALMIVNDLDARLAIYPDSVSDEYPFNLHKDDPMIPWMPAHLHELKLDILVAMGDSERAEIEAQFCKEAYESIEDFASATRMYQTLSSLRKNSGKSQENDNAASNNALNFFAEGQPETARESF